MYLPYALFCEGPSDFAYLEVLIPRVIDDLVRDRGRLPVDVPSAPAFRLGQSGRSVDAVAQEACDKREAFLLTLIHADTGGTNQAQTLDSRSAAYCARIQEVCGLAPARCVLICPRHETEAWALADPAAVLDALGYGGPAADLGLPNSGREAERLPNPKDSLRMAVTRARGRNRHGRDASAVLPAIAQRQSIDALRGAPYFKRFEESLVAALRDVGAL